MFGLLIGLVLFWFGLVCCRGIEEVVDEGSWNRAWVMRMWHDKRGWVSLDWPDEASSKLTGGFPVFHLPSHSCYITLTTPTPHVRRQIQSQCHNHVSQGMHVQMLCF
jgi:hypothetical protein